MRVHQPVSNSFKKSLNMVNLLQTFEKLLLQNSSKLFVDLAHKILLRHALSICSTGVPLHYPQNNNQRQFEYLANLMQTQHNS